MRQGIHPISPDVFLAHLKKAMDKVKNDEKGIFIHGIHINKLRFADNIDVFEEENNEFGSKTK